MAISFEGDGIQNLIDAIKSRNINACRHLCALLGAKLARSARLTELKRLAADSGQEDIQCLIGALRPA